MWNIEVFGDLQIRKASLLQDLSLLDGLDEVRSIDEEGKARKLVVMRDFDQLIEMEEVSWR